MSRSDPLAAVQQYINAFNKGDADAMAATFAAPGSIFDGTAPHVWLGPTAAQDWYRDVLREGKAHGATDCSVTLGEPLHNVIAGDAAYEGWRIAAWAWVRGELAAILPQR